MRRMRSNISAGILLIVIGILALSYQMMPAWWNWLQVDVSWPLIIIGAALLMLVFGLLGGVPAMAVPASIVGGVGALLYWQNATGNWESWAYAWTLIPGFVGVGIILAALLGEGRLSDGLNAGGILLLISLTMFAIFGSFLGGPNLFGPYWPVLLIALGVLIFVRSLLRRS